MNNNNGKFWNIFHIFNCIILQLEFNVFNVTLYYMSTTRETFTTVYTNRSNYVSITDH